MTNQALTIEEMRQLKQNQADTVIEIQRNMEEILYSYQNNIYLFEEGTVRYQPKLLKKLSTMANEYTIPSLTKLITAIGNTKFPYKVIVKPHKTDITTQQKTKYNTSYRMELISELPKLNLNIGKNDTTKHLFTLTVSNDLENDNTLLTTLQCLIDDRLSKSHFLTIVEKYNPNTKYIFPLALRNYVQEKGISLSTRIDSIEVVEENANIKVKIVTTLEEGYTATHIKESTNNVFAFSYTKDISKLINSITKKKIEESVEKEEDTLDLIISLLNKNTNFECEYWIFMYECEDTPLIPLSGTIEVRTKENTMISIAFDGGKSVKYTLYLQNSKLLVSILEEEYNVEFNSIEEIANEVQYIYEKSQIYYED